MSRLKKDPLRPFRPEERLHLERLSRALGLPAALVARAKVLLAVANGYSYRAAAQQAGRRTGDAVAALVSLFNRQGLAALEPRHAGGPAVLYDAAAKERILAEFHRKPDRARWHRHVVADHAATLVGSAYLNDQIIPALCRKAGLPDADSRGALTSHRARATIATQLLNADEPLTLADLQQWLGHKHPASTRHYAAILQRRLSAAYKKADYFARNVRTIQVLIDRESILSGAAAKLCLAAWQSGSPMCQPRLDQHRERYARPGASSR